MSKWILYSLFGLVIILGSVFLILKSPSRSSLQLPCAFCDQEVLLRQKFYEDDLVIALYTHKPIVPGHCLVIPKRHVERFEMLTEGEMSQMGRVIQKVHGAASNVFQTSSYLLLQKNGIESGQTVPHVHFHYIPRKEGDGSVIKFFIQMSVANLKSPIDSEEMEKVVEEMKGAISASKTH